MTEASDLFTRDGHLTMLTLDRYELGELDGDERRCLESHVETCPMCRARLMEIASPSLTLVPPAELHHETGSATIGYLAASAGAALAAGLVGFVGATVMPSPQVATLAETETAGMASAYTSVAHEYSDPDAPTVDLSVEHGELVVRSSASSIAMLRVLVADEGGGTGGQDPTMEIVEMLPFANRVEDRVFYPMPHDDEDGEVVLVACGEPVTFEAGAALDLDGGCTLVQP